MRGSAGYGSGDGVINRYRMDAVTFADRWFDILITINLMFSVILLLPRHLPLVTLLSRFIGISVPYYLLLHISCFVTINQHINGWYCYNITPVILWMLSASLS